MTFPWSVFLSSFGAIFAIVLVGQLVSSLFGKKGGD